MNHARPSETNADGASAVYDASQGQLLPGERWDVFCALPPGVKAILDVGCGAGLAFQRYLRQGVRVVGVDNERDALAQASAVLRETVLLDVESDEWPIEFAGAFDVVAFCDCLEHLKDPWRVLNSVRTLLRRDGVVVASIPNLRQIRLLAKLALGRFDYVRGPGTVQRAHLRFFTRRTVRDMFLEAGYLPPRFFFPTQTFHLRPPERLLNRLTFGQIPDLLYGSYTVAARPVA